MLSIDDFDKVDMRVGTIIDVGVNKRAKQPAYKIKIDIGEYIEIKTSSAQITDLYSMEELLEKQVIVVTNFETMRIADVKSEVRILGADTNDGCVILNPERKIENGSKIF